MYDWAFKTQVSEVCFERSTCAPFSSILVCKSGLWVLDDSAYFEKRTSKLLFSRSCMGIELYNEVLL